MSATSFVTFPTLETDRLLMRAFSISDAADVQRMAGERDIASTTLSIPHPYEDGMAEAWIVTHNDMCRQGTGYNAAITRKSDGLLLGAIGLCPRKGHDIAEMGYWIGKPYWGLGYCTEAADALLAFGFELLDLNRIYATCLSRNPASAKIMIKIGMISEGSLREHVKKWDVYEDLLVYGILKREWLIRSRHSLKEESPE